jgi:hypothetical protein
VSGGGLPVPFPCLGCCRPWARDVWVSGGAEAPGTLDCFGDAYAGTGDDLGLRGEGRRQQEGIAGEVRLVVGETDAQRLGQLAWAGAELDVGTIAAALAHRLKAVGRLQRPDQDCGRLALRFGYRVEQAVDAVREVDVGAAGRAEEDSGALGEADVGVAGGVVRVVTLGLDDGAADAVKQKRAADQIASDRVDRAIKELLLEPLAQPRSSSTLAWTAASVSCASPICSAKDAEPVPPAIRFDSSQLLCCSTS